MTAPAAPARATTTTVPDWRLRSARLTAKRATVEDELEQARRYLAEATLLAEGEEEGEGDTDPRAEARRQVATLQARLEELDGALVTCRAHLDEQLERERKARLAKVCDEAVEVADETQWRAAEVDAAIAVLACAVAAYDEQASRLNQLVNQARGAHRVRGRLDLVPVGDRSGFLRHAASPALALALDIREQGAPLTLLEIQLQYQQLGIRELKRLARREAADDAAA